MADTRLSLSWNAHQKNIRDGLGLLQQRGEFVDMTLAADGHHVKVHQIVMSLVSPYIKELIISAQCPHPVIFLNNISHQTLCLILEYIYTGEVNVPKECLLDLLAAGKGLQIKGIKDMELQKVKDPISDANITSPQKTLVDEMQEIKENKKCSVKIKDEQDQEPVCNVFIDVDAIDDNQDMETDDVHIVENPTDLSTTSNTQTTEKTDSIGNPSIFKRSDQPVQYSVSNQGGLQLIFNRYIYNLKYVQKKLLRFWRCVESSNKRCPANVYTNDKNEIVMRKFTHNHPFHDDRIFKKVRLDLVYAVFNEALTAAKKKKPNKSADTELSSLSLDTDSE